MKLKENFVLRRVLNNWVVLPLGSATVDFNGILNLNDSGALLWQQLEHAADELRFAGITEEQLMAHLQKGANHD